MIRIKDEELCAMDVEWYGIDKKGNVAVFCSAGTANVPEFICAGKERYEKLVYLFDKLPVVSDTLVCFKPCKKNHLPVEVAETFQIKAYIIMTLMTVQNLKKIYVCVKNTILLIQNLYYQLNIQTCQSKYKNY